MPRTPTYGRATGPGDAVGSSIYEMYAPQRASTEFGVDYARTGFELQKEVEFEKQRQLDAQIAQHELSVDLQKQEDDHKRRKSRKGQRTKSAAAGATLGAKLGAFVPGGSIVGGLLGGAAGWMFGQEGGMVPAINPDSLLYKQYQAGGDVTGYSGGQPKFLRRGYQNLQFRQEDLSRAQENLDKMKSYGFLDAIKDIGKGYMAGKELAPAAESLMSLAGASKDIIKKDGAGTFWDIITGKSTPGTGSVEVPKLLKPDSPLIDQVGGGRMSLGKNDMDQYIAKILSGVTKTKPKMAPVRNATYNRNPIKKKTNTVRDRLIMGTLGGEIGARGPIG